MLSFQASHVKSGTSVMFSELKGHTHTHKLPASSPGISLKVKRMNGQC